MRIAVVGSGIAGLGSAWQLGRAYEMPLLEQERRVAGHTDTVVHSADGRWLANLSRVPSRGGDELRPKRPLGAPP